MGNQGVRACYFCVSGPRKTKTSYCRLSAWLLCISCVPNNHSISPWLENRITVKHSGTYVGLLYEKGWPHVHANICMKIDSVGTHNLSNISTWKVEQLQEGHLNRSQGPLLVSHSCSHRHTHDAIRLFKAFTVLIHIQLSNFAIIVINVMEGHCQCQGN